LTAWASARRNPATHVKLVGVILELLVLAAPLVAEGAAGGKGSAGRRHWTRRNA
jgi:hypothetical protein